MAEKLVQATPTVDKICSYSEYFNTCLQLEYPYRYYKANINITQDDILYSSLFVCCGIQSVNLINYTGFVI